MKMKLFQQWLDSFLNFEKTRTKNIFWLETMKFLCKKAGNPQNLVPCIHVAGSKGKGSVSKMLACMIEAGGKKCGLYTSPHICNFRERIGSSMGFFEESVYEKSADELYSLVTSIPKEEFPAERPVTWFELVTLYAFICFKNAKVDFAVYETGLGGRLDSTNIVIPQASVITLIELEHTDILGNSIEKIASEKAGIIKQKIPCVIAHQKYNEPYKVFEEKSKELKSHCILAEKMFQNENYSYKNNRLFFKLKYSSACNALKKDEEYEILLKMAGNVQLENAQTAIAALKTVFPNATKKQIEQGLSNALLPGRFQIENIKGATCVLDGAHTPSSIENCVKTLKEVFPNRTYCLLFACAIDKDVKDIVPIFKETFKNVFITLPGFERKSDIKNIENQFIQNKIECVVDSNCNTAIKNALLKAETENSVLLITGSFYLLSEVFSLYIEKKHL